MKKILFLILLLFTINVYADETTLYYEINNQDDINNLVYNQNIKELLIKDMIIDDISFINKLENLQKIYIFYSKVDLSNFNNKNINEISFISSYIVNDDMSKLSNANIKKIDFDGSYITSIYTLKDIISLEELSLNSISNLRSLEPITNLPNLKVLNFVGSEELINDKVLNYMKEKGIIGNNYTKEQYIYLNNGLDKRLDDIINELNLDELDTLGKIRKITLYVTNLITYDDDCGTNNKCSNNDDDFNILLKSLSGKGICYNYALLTNKLLNRIGVKSYLVSGYNSKGIAHEWINVYLDKKWYGLDPTWIDTYVGVERTLKQTGKSRFFMSDLDTDKTFSNVRVADVTPSKIVDPEAIIIDKVDVKQEELIVREKDSYYTLFIVSIIILMLSSILIFSKLIIKILKKYVK